MLIYNKDRERERRWQIEFNSTTQNPWNNINRNLAIPMYVLMCKSVDWKTSEQVSTQFDTQYDIFDGTFMYSIPFPPRLPPLFFFSNVVAVVDSKDLFIGTVKNSKSWNNLATLNNIWFSWLIEKWKYSILKRTDAYFNARKLDRSFQNTLMWFDLPL